MLIDCLSIASAEFRRPHLVVPLASQAVIRCRDAAAYSNTVVSQNKSLPRAGVASLVEQTCRRLIWEEFVKASRDT